MFERSAWATDSCHCRCGGDGSETASLRGTRRPSRRRRRRRQRRVLTAESARKEWRRRGRRWRTDGTRTASVRRTRRSHWPTGRPRPRPLRESRAVVFAGSRRVLGHRDDRCRWRCRHLGRWRARRRIVVVVATAAHRTRLPVSLSPSARSRRVDVSGTAFENKNSETRSRERRSEILIPEFSRHLSPFRWNVRRFRIFFYSPITRLIDIENIFKKNSTNYITFSKNIIIHKRLNRKLRK